MSAIFSTSEPISEIWVNVYSDELYGLPPYYGAKWQIRYYADLAITPEEPALYRIHVIPKPFNLKRHLNLMDESV